MTEWIVDKGSMADCPERRTASAQALEQAGPGLVEPIMLVTVSVPEDAVGDLNSTRRDTRLLSQFAYSVATCGRSSSPDARSPSSGSARWRPFAKNRSELLAGASHQGEQCARRGRH